MEDNIYYVYVHRKLSDNSIFYVGKGCKQRCRSTNGRNRDWWEVVLNENGFIPEIKLSDLTNETALEKEKELILEIGIENLTNCLPFNSATTLDIPETKGVDIPYEATKKFGLELIGKMFKKQKQKQKRKKDYSFLDSIFKKEEGSILKASEIKNKLKEIGETCTAAKVARHFNAENKNVRTKAGVFNSVIGVAFKAQNQD